MSVLKNPHRPRRRTPNWRLGLALTMGWLLAAAGARAQAVGGTWLAQGPSPIVFGQVENVTPDDPVSGAVHTVAPHPTKAGHVYVGGVNGGIWKTTNAKNAKPNWRRLTDDKTSLSIGALEFDPTDPTHNTLVAAIGNTSSFGVSGPFAGLLRTTDGGANWTEISGSGLLNNKSLWGVAARGTTLVVASRNAVPFTFPNVGIFRSIDGGTTFTQISNGNGTLTGLPGGLVFDLVGDPLHPNRLWTGVTSAEPVGGRNGLYRSDDIGATWTRVSSPAVEATIITGVTGNIELAVGRHNNVYAAIVNNGRLGAVWRSGDGGATWTAMSLPTTTEAGVQGAHPGGQGTIHLSIAADPTDPNIVYIGGDRQPHANEPGGPTAFPNSIGAVNFSGRLFRGDASQPLASQWVHLTHSNALGAPGGGTASGSSPHADSREMAFDADGNLLETDDGGIFRRTQPRSNAGDWVSVQGDLQLTEYHALRYDGISRIPFGGAQDNGTSYKLSPASGRDWTLWVGGDGGDTEVDLTLWPPNSTRFTSAQFLGAFNRSFWDLSNTNTGFDFPALTVVSGSPLAAQFYTPIRLNKTDQSRLIIGGGNGVYESADQGDTLVAIGPGLVINGGGDDPIAYGAFDNPDVLYFGVNDRLFVRTAAHPAPPVQSLTFPAIGAGFRVRDVVIDPFTSTTAVACTAANVFLTKDAGATWTTITGNLPTFNPGIFRSLVYTPTILGDAVVVGTNRGAFIAIEDDGFATWHLLGSQMPNTQIFDFDHSLLFDTLYAGTLGRGAFRLPGLTLAVAQVRFFLTQETNAATQGGSR